MRVRVRVRIRVRGRVRDRVSVSVRVRVGVGLGLDNALQAVDPSAEDVDVVAVLGRRRCLEARRRSHAAGSGAEA